MGRDQRRAADFSIRIFAKPIGWKRFEVTEVPGIVKNLGRDLYLVSLQMFLLTSSPNPPSGDLPN